MLRYHEPRCKFCRFIRGNPERGEYYENLFFLEGLSFSEIERISKENNDDIGNYKSIGNHLRNHAIFTTKILELGKLEDEIGKRICIFIGLLDLIMILKARIERELKGKKLTQQWVKVLISLGELSLKLADRTIELLRELRVTAVERITPTKMKRIFIEALKEAEISPSQIETIKRAIKRLEVEEEERMMERKR